jgi:hypothetical protein
MVNVVETLVAVSHYHLRWVSKGKEGSGGGMRKEGEKKERLERWKGWRG